jgi:signal transduction histidine kinase
VLALKVKAVFRSSTDPNYRSARREFSARRARLLLWCIATIYSAFGLLDWLVYPEWIALFGGYRAGIAAISIFLLLIEERVPRRGFPKLVLAFSFVATSGVIVMCAVTEGFASRYLVGVILCQLGIATVEVAQPRLLAAILCSLAVVYAGVNAAVPFEQSEIISSLAFLVGAVFFCVACSALIEQQRRELFATNAELLERNAQLERAKQQQGKFLSTISHELRSPINSVLGFAELVLERELSLHQKSRDNLSRIQQSGRHLLRLVNDLLDLAKTEAGRMELEISSFDLAPLVHDVADQTRALISDRPVVVHAEAPACMIRSDPTRLRQILVNLASNAAKFTSEGEIRISAALNRDDLVLEVSDTGVGIADEHRELIFEAFRQVHRGLGVGGTGLGLSIVSHLVDLLKGQVEVESELGRGSVFRVRLERVVERSAA